MKPDRIARSDPTEDRRVKPGLRQVNFSSDRIIQQATLPNELQARPSFLSPRTLRLIVFFALSACVLWAAIGAIHWPIVGDAPLLHYVVFLHDHGFAPYTQAVDMNMPGTYALEWTAIHLFGPGPLAWRLFDYVLLLFCGVPMIAIAVQLEIDWMAGFFAAALFALVHLRDGPTHTGQRDLMMTAMLLPACAALFYALRRISQPNVLWPVAIFGLGLGMATIVKPSGVSFAVALAVLLWQRLDRLKQPRTTIIFVATTAFLIPIAGAALYLHAHGAIAGLIGTVRGVDAYHASLGRPSLAALIVGSFPSILLAVVLPVLPIVFATREWRSWPMLVIVICTLLGCASYIFQGKGYPYHRYPTEAFLLLAIALIAFPLLTRTGWPRCFAIATVLLGALYLAPASATIVCHYDGRNQEFNHMLAADLTKLGGNQLQHRVQCVDTSGGCINTLYNMQLVEATGYVYDCYLFPTAPNPVREQYRAGFLAQLAGNPPDVMIVTNQDCYTLNRSFNRLATWPEFNAMLTRDYTVTTERTPPHRVGWWRHPAEPFSYRIYIRNTAAGNPH